MAASSTTDIASLWDEISTHESLFPRASAQDFVRRRRRLNDYAQPSDWSLSQAKRRVDFLVAGMALLLFWPLLLLVAVLVRFRSPGPIIFRQKRVGLGGEPFTVYKFRTMEVPDGESGPSMTKRGDPRITAFGRFLRKYKLDELPQLVNVMRGEMSLVGPRPRLPHHMETIQLPFRPGITGAATIAFRNEEVMLQNIPDGKLEEFNTRKIIPLKAKLDWSYMANATLFSDIGLLFETAACCISARRSPTAINL